MVLNDPVLFEKYEDFTLRRILAIDPDTRWCPAPDCGYVMHLDDDDRACGGMTYVNNGGKFKLNVAKIVLKSG